MELGPEIMIQTQLSLLLLPIKKQADSSFSHIPLTFVHALQLTQLLGIIFAASLGGQSFVAR